MPKLVTMEQVKLMFDYLSKHNGSTTPPQPQPEPPQPPQPPVVPPTPKEPSDSEKQSYMQNRSAMEIKPSDTELLPGWKPFANAKSGAEIIQKAMQDGSYKNLLKPGDYIIESVTTGNYTCNYHKWTISEFDHYGRNEALMIPENTVGEGFVYQPKSTYGGIKYSNSNVAKACDEFYNNMPDTLKPYVKQIVVNTSDEFVMSYVFPPNVIERFGVDYESVHDTNDFSFMTNVKSLVNENSTEFKQYEYFKKNDVYSQLWLRHSSINSVVCNAVALTNWNGYLYVCKNEGKSASSTSSVVELFPCFCIG